MSSRSKLFEKIIFYLSIWTVLQDFVLPIILNITNSVLFTKILFFSKDVLMISLFIWSLFRIKKFKLLHFIILLFYFLILFIQLSRSLLFNNIDIVVILSSTRSWLLAPCFITIGCAIKNLEYFKKKMKHFMNFLLFTAVIGIIEYLIDVYVTSTIPFWTNVIKIGDYMTLIKDQGNRLHHGLPGNFYGQYGGEFFSQKRLVSFWAVPLTAAYILSIPTIYYFIIGFKNKNSLNIIKSLVILLAVWLTHTRAISLQLLVVLFLIPFFLSRKVRKYYLLLIPLIFIVVIVQFDQIYAFIYDGSTIEHIRQFTESFAKLNFFGNGIGTFGVDANITTESAYISCFGQLGFFGFIAYVLINLFIPFYCFTNKKRKNKYVYILFIAFVFLVTGLVSEQLIAYTSVAPYYVFISFYYNYSKNNRIQGEK